MNVSVYHNGDDVFIAWKPKGFIKECRGFALLRRRNGVEETVSTWVGFEDDEYARVGGTWLHTRMRLTSVFLAPHETGWQKIFS